MKPTNVKPNTYINTGKHTEINAKSKFKVSDHVWIWTYKSVIVKGYQPNLSGVSVTESENTIASTHVIEDLN